MIVTLPLHLLFFFYYDSYQHIFISVLKKTADVRVGVIFLFIPVLLYFI